MARAAEAGAEGREGEPPLIRVLAHELRTPLAAIAALAEVMRDERLGPIGQPQYLGYAGDIHASAKHALEVLDGAVAGGAGQVKPQGEEGAEPALDMTNVDVAVLAAAVTSGMRALAQSYGVGLVLSAGERPPLLVANARCLRQILFNLIFNAVRSSPPGRVVTVAVASGQGGGLEVSVSDLGDGFRAERLAEIRRRIDEATAGEAAPAGEDAGGWRMRASNGIGLPLVAALARANGGVLSVSSTAGQGASVTVRFPAGRLIPV